MCARAATNTRDTSIPSLASMSSSFTRPCSETTVPAPISSFVPSTSTPDGTTCSASLVSPTSIEWPALSPPPNRAITP